MRETSLKNSFKIALRSEERKNIEAICPDEYKFSPITSERANTQDFSCMSALFLLVKLPVTKASQLLLIISFQKSEGFIVATSARIPSAPIVINKSTKRL